MNTRKVAQGLGWFSIALGVSELVFGRTLAKTLGVKSPLLIRMFGLREIAAGVGLLTLEKKGPWIWARIAGDALDAAVLGAALTSKNKKRGNAAIALAAVSPVVALDIVCGKQLGVSA